MSFVEQLTSYYEGLRQRGAGQAFRERAWDQYSRLGLPGRKTETWKYTSLDALACGSWTPADREAAAPEEVSRLRERWAGLFDVAVLVNGRLRNEFSSASVAQAVLEGDIEVEDGFAGLMAGLSEGGWTLKLNSSPRRPLLVIHARTGERTWSSGFHRLVAGADVRADIAEVFIGAGLRAEIMRGELGPGARVNWVRLQQDDLSAAHFADTAFELGAGASLNYTQIQAGAAWSRVNTRVRLRAAEAEALVHGLTFGRGNSTWINAWKSVTWRV
ncbi:MAG: hypothetical protein HC902_05360 [Calothrix sp. SM1_5_4]|nr:hypothetical protein [Calothrix sp. SM1_5_4]